MEMTKKELYAVPAWGTGTALYIIAEGSAVYGQFGGVGSNFAELRGEELVQALLETQIDKQHYWFEDEQDVKDYLAEIKKGETK